MVHRITRVGNVTKYGLRTVGPAPIHESGMKQVYVQCPRCQSVVLMLAPRVRDASSCGCMDNSSRSVKPNRG